MATLMEKDVLIEKTSSIAFAITKNTKLKGETASSQAAFSWISESRQFLLSSAPSDIDFMSWVNILNSIKARYER